MSSIQETVYRFYNTYLQARGLRTTNIDTNSATYEFLGDQGFLQSSLTSRWKAFADFVGYAYVGDLDIQNKVASGVIPSAPAGSGFLVDRFTVGIVDRFGNFIVSPISPRTS